MGIDFAMRQLEYGVEVFSKVLGNTSEISALVFDYVEDAEDESPYSSDEVVNKAIYLYKSRARQARLNRKNPYLMYVASYVKSRLILSRINAPNILCW